MLEKIKGFKVLNKVIKSIICIVIFFVGAMGGTFFSEESPEYIKVLEGKASVDAEYEKASKELSESVEDLDEAKENLSDLNIKVTTYNDKIQFIEDEIENINKEKIAKEEADRLAKEEADRIAREEAAKQQAIASANKPSGGQSSNSKPSGGQSSNNKPSGGNQAVEPNSGVMVFTTASGKKYHRINNCGKTNPSTTSKVTVEKAKASGLSACTKCY